MPHVRRSVFDAMLKSWDEWGKQNTIQLINPETNKSIFDLNFDLDDEDGDVIFRYKRNGKIVYHKKSRDFMTSYENTLIKVNENLKHLLHSDNTPVPPEKKKNIMDPNHEPSEKSKLLTQLKDSVSNKRRFKKGAYLMLRTKLLDRTGRMEKIYVVRQVIWSIDDVVIKGLVVKQLVGVNLNMSSLSRNDCLILHVKYEPGLQLLSMELPWLPVTVNKLKKLSNNAKK